MYSWEIWGSRVEQEWGAQCKCCWDKECSQIGEDEQGSSRDGDGEGGATGQGSEEGHMASSSELWCSECLVGFGNYETDTRGVF